MFADALCRAALKKKGAVTLDNIAVVALADNHVCYIADTYPLEDPCRICGEHGEGSILCNLCNGTYHRDCLGEEVPETGMWYCPECMKLIRNHQIEDMTVDLNLMRAVFGLPHPTPLATAEKARLQDALRWMKARDNEWYISDGSGRE